MQTKGTSKMAQPNITSFFKIATPKRSTEEEGGKPKRQKNDEDQSDSILKPITTSNTTISNMGTSWFNALEPEFKKDYFKKLSSFLEQERKTQTIYPPVQQVYTWTQTCKINEVKVVILGQDPYHGPRQAHGLCFSVQVSLRK